MKDNFTAIILSAVIIFLVGAGVVLVSNQGDVNVSSTSNPTNNAEGNPSVTPQSSDSQSIGYSARPGDVVLTKYLDYDDITTTGVAVTNPVTGEFTVENVIMEMGANTMASGTLFQIITTEGATAYSDFGTSTVLFSTQVSAFTKNLTMDLNTAIGDSTHFAGTASSTQRVVLGDGAYLTAKCTTASCKLSQIETELGTAGRNMKVTVVLKRVDSSSSIYE